MLSKIIESTFDNAKKRSSVYDPLNINSEIPMFFLKRCDRNVIENMIKTYSDIKATAERFLYSAKAETVEMEDFYGHVLSEEELTGIIGNCERKISQLKKNLDN